MKVQVSVNNVRIIEPSILNENEYNIHNCEFEFTEEYNGLTKKAVFTNEANETYVETIVDNKCSIPSEVLKDKENVKLGVYAYDVDNEELLLRYSPRPTEFYVHEGSYKEGQNSTPPTPSEIEQLQAQITQNANDIDTLEDSITLIDQQQEIQDETIQNNTEAIGTINETIGTINQTIGEINTDIQELQTTKADKSEIPTKTSDLINDSDFVSDSEYVHTDNNFTDENEAQITTNKNDIATLQSTKADKSEIPTKTSDLTNDSGFINKNVNDLTNYTLKTNTGSLIDLEINGTTYVITLSLKDVDGTVISTDTIDLPLESVVVGGSYDSANQKIVLILENGNTVDIPVGDLIAGLQTEITSQNKLASDLVDDSNSGNKFVTTSEKQAWNAKYDKPVGGIPSTDLSSGVQASLDKADTAIQENDLADYVKNTDYANGSKGGTIKVASSVALAVDTGGILYGQTKQYNEYSTGANSMVVSKGTLENVITGKELINQTQLEESQAIQDTEIEALQAENAELKQDITNMAKAMYKVDGQGSDITLENTTENKFVEFGLEGRTEQDGEPTPETPIPIKNVTGNANVKIQNKNLLPNNAISQTLGGIEFTINDDGTILANGTSTDNVYLYLEQNYELQPGTYTLSGASNKTLNYWLRLFNATNNFDNLTAPVTFTIEKEETLKVLFRVRSGVTLNNLLIKPQLEQGTTATSYVPHQEQNYPFTFESGQFLADDENLKDNGMLKKWKQVTFSGTTITLEDAKTNGAYFCNKKVAGNLVGQTLTFDEEVTNAVIQYELAEEEIIPYNSTQQAQYNNIKANASSYDDITIISSESDELGFNMNVVAVADANKVIENQNNEIDTIKSRLDLLEG